MSEFVVKRCPCGYVATTRKAWAGHMSKHGGSEVQHG